MGFSMPYTVSCTTVLFFSLATLFCNIWPANGDVYLHMPRGSNNRLNGANANVRNQNRLFDSQNNAKGGYNVGEKYSNDDALKRTFGINRPEGIDETWSETELFMSGRSEKSQWIIEWTNQHGCGDGDLNCNIVLQYMIQTGVEKSDPSRIRNGANTRTPPYSRPRTYTSYATEYNTMKGAQRSNAGLNENWKNYDKCANRQRNKGLFIADQDLKGDSSKYTRQNPQGTRRGYECPEERDYYPYWHPTPWIDIAVLVDDVKDCNYYTSESFNQQPKGECVLQYREGTWGRSSKQNNPRDCRNEGGIWVMFQQWIHRERSATTYQACMGKRESYMRDFNLDLKWGVPYIDKLDPDPEKWEECLAVPKLPECLKTPHSRSNHLGNGLDVKALRYIWQVPNLPGDSYRGVLRIRYNISTDDYNTSTTFAESNEQEVRGLMVTNRSPIENDPEVEVGRHAVPLRLAINTAQYARTFQDRSHVFNLMKRPAGMDCKTIHNLNVRGKRGNIVQTYPAVEYDFIPNNLTMSSRDCLHVQWEGSNRNPNNNAGEGQRGTDRSNFMLMEEPGISYPKLDAASGINNRFPLEHNEQTTSLEDITVFLATGGSIRTKNDMNKVVGRINNNRNREKKIAESNAFHPNSRGMLLGLESGTYFYMCTRNNNFSNRRQKGVIYVT